LHFVQGHAADVIAMVTHGRGASRLIAASKTDRVLRTSGLPVLVLRTGQGDPAKQGVPDETAGELVFSFA
jgi:hypothetical protein